MYFSEGLAVFDEGFTAFSSCRGMTTYTGKLNMKKEEYV